MKNLHDSLGKLGFTIPKQELDTQTFGTGTHDAILALQQKQRNPTTGVFDEATRAAVSTALGGSVEANAPIIMGRVSLDNWVPASGLTVRLYNRGFGADTLLGEKKTTNQGAYTLPCTTNGKAANIEVRTVGSDGKEVILSDTTYNAGASETLNLVAPTSVQPLTVEYQRLSADLAKPEKIADARETTSALNSLARS